MSNLSKTPLEFRTNTSRDLIGIVIIRILVGAPLGLVGGFIGNIFNGILVPSPAAGDFVAFLSRMIVFGIGASLGSLMSWFNLFESRRGVAIIVVVGTVGGVVGSMIAYYIGSSYIDHPDVYILNQRLTQTVILGTALGANLTLSGLAYFLARTGR
jgi:hypothetical protein